MLWYPIFMTVSITQLQIFVVAAPALLALLLVPGVTLGHPALIARAIIPVVVHYTVDPVQHADSSPSASTQYSPSAAVASVNCLSSLAPVPYGLASFSLPAACLNALQATRAP